MPGQTPRILGDDPGQGRAQQGALALDGKFMTLAQQLVYSFQVSSLCLTDGMSSGSWAYIIRPARQLRSFGDRKSVV